MTIALAMLWLAQSPGDVAARTASTALPPERPQAEAVLTAQAPEQEVSEVDGRVESTEAQSPPPRSAFPAAEAERLYLSLCAPCHGARGRGDGPNASLFSPRPRDFTRGVFKLKSTKSGFPPSDEDLFETISRGIPGTGMPAWGGRLSRENIRLLVGYVKRFSDAFDVEGVEPIDEPTEPPVATDERIRRGRALFADASKGACFQCHGESGRGDGPSAPALVDDAGNPLPPRDLTRPWEFKRGSSARDVFVTLSAGMDGAAMPSYEGALNADERWDLALFVQSLGRRRSWFDYLFDDPYLTGARAAGMPDEAH